jgi:nonsense-mediated mRNA decay protein 3
MDVERSRNDYENFLRDLEEDKEMRGEVNLYKDPDALAAAAARKEHPVAADEEDEDDDALSEAEVGLEELLDDLNLADNETFDDFTPPTIFKLPTGGGDFHFT